MAWMCGWPAGRWTASSAPTARASPPCSRALAGAAAGRRRRRCSCWGAICRMPGPGASAPGPGLAGAERGRRRRPARVRRGHARAPAAPGLHAARQRPDHAAVEQALRATQAWDWRERAAVASSRRRAPARAAGARLAVQAQVLLMDEPLANLDPPHQADWMRWSRPGGAGPRWSACCTRLGMALAADELVVMQGGPRADAGACADRPRTARWNRYSTGASPCIRCRGQWVACRCDGF